MALFSVSGGFSPPMQPAQWKPVIAQFAALSRRQRLTGITLLRGSGSKDAAAALIERMDCCVPCGPTFNVLTGTPLARLCHKSL